MLTKIAKRRDISELWQFSFSHVADFGRLGESPGVGISLAFGRIMKRASTPR